MPEPVYLVGCGKAKLEEPAPARDLYTGALFRASLSYAEALAAGSGRVFILSAEYGLVVPGEVLEPYDLHLGALPRAERLAWGERVVRQLVAVAGPVEAAVVLAGRTYAEAVRHGLSLSGRAVRLDEPLDGVAGVGNRIAWLNRRLAEVQP